MIHRSVTATQPKYLLKDFHLFRELHNWGCPAIRPLLHLPRKSKCKEGAISKVKPCQPGGLNTTVNWLLLASTSQHTQLRKQRIRPFLLFPSSKSVLKILDVLEAASGVNFQHYEIRMKWNPTGKSPSIILKILPLVSLLKLVASPLLRADCTPTLGQLSNKGKPQILKLFGCKTPLHKTNVLVLTVTCNIKELWGFFC